MRRTPMPKLVLACLVAALWATASCVLNPQPEPPGSNDRVATGGPGVPTTGSGQITGSTSGAGGSGPAGGFGGGGGAGINGGAGGLFDAATPPPNGDAAADVGSRADASADGGISDEASTTDGAPSSEAGETGPSEGGSVDVSADGDAAEDTRPE